MDPAGVDAKVRTLLPGYMTMGQAGMEMSEHLQHMRMPSNSIPMAGAKGEHGAITMGGMFTVLKVRDSLRGYTDPGWYETPQGTLASIAATDALRRDGISLDAPPGGEAGEAVRFG